MSDPKPTREQERAQAAFQIISRVSNEDWAKEYGRQCLHLPVLIHQCGLCQAVTFLEAKGADEKDKPWFKALLNNLAIMTKIGQDWHTLNTKVRAAHMQEYQWMTREALACTQWLKRYAEAVLKVELGKEDDQTS